MKETYGLPNVQVKKIMTRDAVTVDEDDSLEVLIEKFRKYGFHGFSVLKKGKLVGIVTKTDLIKTFERESLSDVFASHVKDIMTSPPTTITPETYVVDAVDILLKQGVTMLPVTKNEKLVGVLSHTDVIDRILKRFIKH